MNKKVVFVIKKDEEIISSILNFCEQRGLKSAWINGIGAIKSATLAAYDLEKKEYKKKDLSGKFEIVNLTGNIGMLGEKPVTHLHVVLSDDNMATFGGHLEKAIVSVTCEIILTLLQKQIERKYDNKIGLNLIQPVKYPRSK